MGITFTSTAAGCQNKFFAFFIDLTNDFASVGFPGDSAKRNFEDFVFAVRAGAVLLLTGPTSRCNHMLAIFEVQQGPKLRIAAQDYVASFASIAPVRPAVRHELFPMEMGASGTAVSRSGVEFYVINEVRRGHRKIF